MHVACNAPPAVNDAQSRAAQWLRASRAGETQEKLAADIEQVTGWHITRDRYSKYESGSLPMGPAVLARFVDYWASRGKPGPESTEPASEAVTVPEAGAYFARIDALVGAVTGLVEELRAARQDQDDLRERVEALEAAAKLQARPAVGVSGTPRTPGRIGESA